MTRIEHGRARLITRGGHDWTSKMQPLAAAIEALGIDSAWLDGEIVVMSPAGVPDFNALQNAIDSASAEAIEYFVFDLPFHAGRDLRQVPVRSRRALLKTLLDAAPSDRVRLSQTFDAPPAQMLEAARRMHLEGIILKRADAPYVSRRSETWLKLKCSLRQEFVVCGFTDRANAAGEVGSLLLGTYESGELVYSGNVGTGWGAKTGRDLYTRLVALETKTPTLAIASIQPGRWSRRTAGSERWVKPSLVVEVSFREWTPEGHIRHAVYEALRADKPAREVRREVASAGPASDAGASASVPQARRRARRRPCASATPTASSTHRPASPSSRSCAITRASPSASCRTSRTGRSRWCAPRKASPASCSSRSTWKRACPACASSMRALWPGHSRCSASTAPMR